MSHFRITLVTPVFAKRENLELRLKGLGRPERGRTARGRQLAEISKEQDIAESKAFQSAGLPQGFAHWDLFADLFYIAHDILVGHESFVDNQARHISEFVFRLGVLENATGVIPAEAKEAMNCGTTCVRCSHACDCQHRPLGFFGCVCRNVNHAWMISLLP